MPELREVVARAQGNEDLLFHLGFNQAIPATERPTMYVALQRRHPDGRRWVEVAPPGRTPRLPSPSWSMAVTRRPGRSGSVA